MRYYFTVSYTIVVISLQIDQLVLSAFCLIQVNEALDYFQGDVKCAIVALLSGNRQKAQKALDDANGRVRDALQLLNKNSTAR